MKKSVSIFTIMVVGIMSVAQTYGAPMTPQIQRLLDQKEEKIKKLEECEGKKQGWMIAGISTIGLTAVGVGVNIAQASKSNRLSDEIDSNKRQLERQREHLDQLNTSISAKERERAERERAEREKAERDKLIAEWDGAVVGQMCDDTGKTRWVVMADGDTECLDGNAVKHLCGCGTQDVGTISKGRSSMGSSDGKIGDPCDDDNGTWELSKDGGNICTDESGSASFKCACVQNESMEKVEEKSGGGENAESGCEKYNHYEIKLSDNNTEYVYNFLYGDEDCKSRFVARCSDIGGEWVFGAWYSSREIWEYRCWNPKALGRDYSGLGFDDFVKQECERYGGEANRSNAFMYYCVGIKNNECNKIKTAFEAAGYPDPITVSFDKKLKDAQTGAWTSFSGWQSKEVNWKNVCTIEAFGNDVEEYIYNPQ